MRQVIPCALMILGLLVIGAVQAYCGDPPGKRRMPWDSQEYKKQTEIETAKRIFNSRTTRDPFKPSRLKYIPDCGNPKRPADQNNMLTAKKERGACQ